MRPVPERGSAGGGPATGRDPWAGFGAGPQASGSPVPGSPAPGYPASGPAAPGYPASGPQAYGAQSRHGNGAGDPGDERAVADLARRLQDRVDGQEALLDRVADLAARADDRARVSELREATRRVRRDSEVLLLLCGVDPGVHRGTPVTVPTVLGDALALVDEPSRVALAPVPSATLAAAAVVELRHLVAELVDEAAAAAPGARVEVGGRLEIDGTLSVQVVVAGRGRPDALGGAPRGYGGASRLAERLARRSTGGIRLERPMMDGVEGLFATLRCPAALVTAQDGGADPWRSSSPEGSSESFLSGSSFPGSSSGSGFPGSSFDGSSFDGSSFDGPSFDGSSYSGSGYPGSSRSGADTSVLVSSPPARSSGDELFGPLPTSVVAVSTPIFEAVASAWFRDDERAPSDWSSPGDREWRAAAARASRTDVEVPTTTASGLPRRSPGDRLVPPPRAARQAAAPDERVPERVRDRLATYQRGLEQGRHRAAEPPVEPSGDAAPEAWTAEGW